MNIVCYSMMPWKVLKELEEYLKDGDFNQRISIDSVIRIREAFPTSMPIIPLMDEPFMEKLKDFFHTRGEDFHEMIVLRSRSLEQPNYQNFYRDILNGVSKREAISAVFSNPIVHDLADKESEKFEQFYESLEQFFFILNREDCIMDDDLMILFAGLVLKG